LPYIVCIDQKISVTVVNELLQPNFKIKKLLHAQYWDNAHLAIYFIMGILRDVCVVKLSWRVSYHCRWKSE